MNDFVKDLVEQAVLAISEGSRGIVVWGVNPDGLDFLSAINSSGLRDFISALVDSRQAMQGRSFLGFEVLQPETLPKLEFDTLVITLDVDKERALEEFSQFDERKPYVILAGSANYEFQDTVYQEILRSCTIKPRAGGYPNMLIHLYQALKHVATRCLRGDIAEFGVYQGGTTIFMAKVLEYYEHPGQIYGFDTFSGFPSPRSVMDVYQDRRCEFPDYEAVRRYCSPHNIELIPGDICETYTSLRGVALALTFFDTDNYSPARQALGMCAEQTVPGGFLVFDHYYSPSWNRTVGERIAVRQVVEEEQFFNLYGTGIFVKV